MIEGNKDGWKEIEDVWDHTDNFYIFMGGRGSCKSHAQLELMKKQLMLWADIQDCNRELDKIKSRQVQK